jgi:hypothetical protein
MRQGCRLRRRGRSSASPTAGPIPLAARGLPALLARGGQVDAVVDADPESTLIPTQPG